MGVWHSQVRKVRSVGWGCGIARGGVGVWHSRVRSMMWGPRNWLGEGRDIEKRIHRDYIRSDGNTNIIHVSAVGPTPLGSVKPSY